MLAHLLSQLFVISVQILLMLLFVLLVFKVIQTHKTLAPLSIRFIRSQNHHITKPEDTPVGAQGPGCPWIRAILEWVMSCFSTFPFALDCYMMYGHMFYVC